MSIRNPWCRPSRLPDRPVSQATHGGHLTSAAHETTRCGPARRAPSDRTVRHPGGGTSKTPPEPQLNPGSSAALLPRRIPQLLPEQDLSPHRCVGVGQALGWGRSFGPTIYLRRNCWGLGLSQSAEPRISPAGPAYCVSSCEWRISRRREVRARSNQSGTSF
jgi:hypothetical protein